MSWHLMQSDWYFHHERQVLFEQFCICVVFWFECDTDVEPLYHPSWLNALSQADLTLDVFPCVLEAMDMLPPKITLISPICSLLSESTRR
jgi:hypothetical protein